LILLVAACVALIVLASAPAAGAATRRATDSEARIRFTLDGRLLTVRVLPRAPRRVRRQLYGNRIQATCGTSFAFASGVKVHRTRRWPRGRRRMRFRFRRDISRRAKWCLVERRGRDVAFATFR
jgi:hypothetical protein